MSHLLLLHEAELKADAIGDELAVSKPGSGDDGQQGLTCVGGAQQPESEDQAHQDGAQWRHAHASYFAVDGVAWCVFTEIEDRRAAAGPEYAVDFVDGSD